MLPKNSRHLLYATLLITLSVVFTSAVANTRVGNFITEIAPVKETTAVSSSTKGTSIEASNKILKKKLIASSGKLITIVQGADQEIVCTDDGSILSKVILCGIFDDRTLSAGSGTIEWQKQLASCTISGTDNCAVNDGSCWPTTSTTSATYSLDASDPNVAGEYRVRSNGGLWYYLRVTQSTIVQTYVKTDFVCGKDGRIQVTELPASFEFSIDNGSGFGPWQGPSFENLGPGTYNVKARQQGLTGACEYPYEPIVIEQQDMAFNVTFVDAECSGDTGSVTVNVNNSVPGPYKYTLLDASGTPQEFTALLPADTYTFAAVGFGTYIVQVETQQCAGDPANGIDPPRESLDTSGNPIVIGNGLVALDASTEVNSSFGCSTIASIDITLNASGGSAPYTFTVNGGPAQPSFTGSTTYNVTAAGTYDFIITDSNGCTIIASSNVEDLASPTITASGLDGTCANGGARVNLNVTNANGYNLSFRVNAADPWVTNPSISVPAGTYNNIEVLYEQGAFQCTLTLPAVTVTNVGVIAGSATKIADRTCDVAGGTIGGQIDFGAVSGGSGSGYVYSIDGLTFSATTSYNDLLAGTYTPMIEDDGGCRLELTPITILNIDPPTDIDFVSTNSNCAANTVDLQLVPTGNAAIANYSIISPTIQDNGGSDTFANLDASQSYIFEITDANNCTYSEGYSPSILSTIRARVKSGADTQVCSGASDGSGTFLLDGYANTYQYQINTDPVVTGQTANEVAITGLGIGTYTITITDEDTGCTDTESFTIAEPAAALVLAGTVTDMSCNNGNQGRVVANTTGGWGNNKYTLTLPDGTTTVGPKSGATFGGLSTPSTPGNPYTLSVEDAEGCTATFTFDLESIGSPTIALDAAASDFCYVPGTGATMVVTSTVGSTPIATHQYRINGGVLQASPTFTNLSPGNYAIEVVDGTNCSATVNITVQPQLRVNASIATPIPCGGAEGQIRVLVSGGYLANATPKFFEVSSDNGAVFTTPAPFTANDFPYDTNAAGTYIFRVSDNEGCLAESTPIVLEPAVSIAAAIIAINPVSCGNSSNGRVTVIPDATSGIPPYDISFNGGAFSPQTVYSNLSAGTYPYVVRDSRGCETMPADAVVGSSTIPSPDATVSQLQASCSAGAVVAGGIQIDNVTNGTENFSFIIEDSFGNQLVRADDVDRASLPLPINDPSLVPGDYTVVTLDNNGCMDIDTMTITTTDVLITPINHTPAVTCDDTSFTYTVEVTPTIFPTVPTYQIRIQGQPSFYALNNNGGNDTHEFSNTADAIEYGVAYVVEVLAPNGCIYEQEIPPIDGFSSIEITATSGGVFCDDNGNGQTDFTIVDFLGPNLTIEFFELGSDVVIDTDSPSGLTGGLGSTYSGSFNAQPGEYQIKVTDSDGCTDATTIDVVLIAPSVYVLSNEPANCNALGQITFVGSGGTPFAGPGGPYLYAVVPQGNPVDEDGTATPGNVTDDFTDETTRVLAGSLTGITYDIWVLDSRGCTFNVTQEVIQLQPNLAAPTFIVDNQCAVASPSFDIIVSVPANVDTPRFTLGGDEQFGVLNAAGTAYEHAYTVGTPGSYSVSLVDANGCTGQGIAVVYEFLSASGGFSTESTCNDADGEITIIPNGGSSDFDYALTGTDHLGGAVTINQSNNAVFTGMTPGNYQVIVTDNLVTDGIANCTFLVDNINLDAATIPVLLTPDVQNITCNGNDDGSIDISLQAGTDVDSPIDYRLVDFTTRALITNNASGSFPNLSPGSYEVEVVTARNCTVLSGRLDITQPPAFEIEAVADPFTCETGANRFSTAIITVNIDPNASGNIGTPTNYRYSITGFENYQTTNTFEIIDTGSTQNITVYAIDDNGCEAASSLVLNPPMDVTSSLAVVSSLNCANPEQVRITVVGASDFTVSTVAAKTVASVTNSTGNDFVDIFLPDSGDFLFEIQDNTPSGCAYPIPIHTVVEPIQPTVSISEAEPIGCFGASDGELTIEVLDYTGLYSYSIYAGDDTGKTTPIATGNLDTANNPETITTLPGGNFFVEITSTATPFCSVESNIATIRTPNGALAVSALEVGNVSCTNNTGIIEATGIGGWDTSPYEYRLLQSADGVAAYSEVVTFSNNLQFTGLSFGFYQVEIRDLELCTSTVAIELAEVAQIAAGIREPLALQCPNGNNAILEAYDITTDTAGASGGFPGAGFTYRLLYLNSNDNTDIASSSGLQNTPTFIGTTGGFISVGWYAIEVTSSFDCVFVTVPYEVNPPSPIEPRLAQTKVPGCGGNGQTRLFIDNHDPLSNFEYEYRQIPTVDPLTDPWIDLGIGVTELFLDVPGSPAGIFYQYEVRKKNGSNTCLPVNTNGITLTDALDIEILPNSPVANISCNSEVDGRIESFIEGGIGDEMFTIYTGDPVNGFNSGSAQIYNNRPAQSLGTFEGLDTGTYYIGVVSGITCEDIAGPFEILRPDPILFTATPIPTTCNGTADGQITIEVTSGGVGLLLFAMAPNFNEFFSEETTPGVYTFDELVAGTYEVLIQDESGCFERTMVEVIEPEVIATNLVDVTPETCIGFADGTAQIAVTGGTPFVDTSTFVTYYETRLVGPDSDGSELYVRNDNLYFDNLIGDESYIVFIRDANDCSTDIILSIEIGVDLTASPKVVYGCEGIFPNSTSTVTMLDTSLLPDLLFALDPVYPADAISSNAGTQTSWGNLSTGDHMVYIYHENGCTNIVTFSIEGYEPLTLTAEKTGPNEVTALAEGGFGNYEYFFQGESTLGETIFNTNESGVVNVEVRDEKGCMATIAIPFEFTGIIEIPNFFTPDGDNNNDYWAPKNRELFPNIDVKIYDRYGRVIAILDQVAKWDGKYEGNELPSGDYWYVINQNDKQQIRYVGHFTLYR